MPRSRAVSFTLLAVCLWCAQAALHAQAARDEAGTLRGLLDRPAPVPRGAASSSETDGTKKPRPSEFFSADRVPPDDAPIEDLIDYWTPKANEFQRGGPAPSDAVRERLLAACEDEPEKLPRLLKLLPETPETAERVKKLYDESHNSDQLDDDWRKSVREWLQFNSRFFIDELAALARKARDKDGYVENDEPLKALAKVAPEIAEPLLQSLAGGGQSRTAALALALLHQNAQAAKETVAEEKYRARLQTIAVDRNAPAWARDMAVETLSLAQWPGRDEWYLSLFEDETLLELEEDSVVFHPLTYLPWRDPKKWIPVMARLVEGKNQTVRDAAAGCLISFQNRSARKDALLPLLPWLSNPGWAKDEGNHRLRLIQSMDFIDLPESVPGLIWVVQHDEGDYNRSYAAESLAKYKDPRAAPALKKALAEESDESHRARLINGLLSCGGMTEAEQVAALEAYAGQLATPEGRNELKRYRSYGDEPLPLNVAIGKQLAGRREEVSDALVRAVLARAESLKEKNPLLARALLEVAEGWQAREVDLDVVRRIGANLADAAMIAGALERRERLRESVGPQILSLAGAGGAAQAVATVLLGDDAMARAILDSRDETAQSYLLACARLTGMPLPVAQVGVLLRSKNPMLALAAEKYLLAEDSAEARASLWAHHPEEAFITGWRENTPMIGGSNFDALGRHEEKLRAELLKEGGPKEIYALLSNGEQYHRVLRVYADRAVYTNYEDASRYRERVVTPEELARFKNYVETNKLTELGPQFSPCHHDCGVSQFLWLARQGGRRMFSHQGFGGWAMALHFNFDLLGQGRGVKIHYPLADEIKGLEILHAEENLQALDVWQKGTEVRVLFQRDATPEEDEQERKEDEQDAEAEEDDEAARARSRRRAVERLRARFSWRDFKDGEVGTVTRQPEGYSIFDEAAFEIDGDNFPSHLNEHAAQAIVGESVVLATQDEDGLWKKAPGRMAVRVGGEGAYANPVAAAGGRWVVAAKTDTHWGEPNYLVRFDLQTGREYRVVQIPAADQLEAVAYLVAHGRVLIRRAGDEDSAKPVGPVAPEYYLLDAATGRAQLVEGNFVPLLQEGKRGLQPAGVPNEFWAALPDREKNGTRVGRYNVKDFSFHALMVVPQLAFDSMEMWIDEAAAKLYVVYKGQLLRMPLAVVSERR